MAKITKEKFINDGMAGPTFSALVVEHNKAIPRELDLMLYGIGDDYLGGIILNRESALKLATLIHTLFPTPE